MSRLAIVIPAFKKHFLYDSLESIANQTNKDFTLYIGDDCSPDDLYSIVKDFRTRVSLTYKRFDNNLGGTDLVAQWERCIDLVRDEEWIWMFSDDDLMSPTCVENFYISLDQFPDFDLFHFNVSKIDGSGKLTNVQFQQFPEVLQIEEFLFNKLQPGYYSTVVEYIFRKTYFFNKGRFEKFDLAWCSDDATWIKLGKRKGIRTIEGSRVFWRESEYNISTIIMDRNILKRKLSAQIDYANWLYRHAVDKNIYVNFTTLREKLRDWFLRSLKFGIKSLPFSYLLAILPRFDRAMDCRKPLGSGVSYLLFYKAYRSLADPVRGLFLS